MRGGDLGAAMARSNRSHAERPNGPPDGDALEARRRRAEEELFDVRVRSREPVLDLEVRNPIHRTRYRVLLPEYPGRGAAFCSCTDFARRGLGTCKHVEAAWLWLEATPELPEAPGPGSPEPPVGELWKEIDRSLGTLGRAPPARIRDVERAGALLFEERPGPEAPARAKGEGVGRGRAGRPPTTTTSRARP